MKLEGNYKEIYEKELRPVIDDVVDPFMSSDLDVDMQSNVIGRVLKRVASDEDYDLDVVDEWPYVFSREDRRDYGSNFLEETVKIGLRASQVLEEQSQLSEIELSSIVDYLVEDDASLSRSALRKGQVKDFLKDSSEIDYIVEEKRFEWNN